MLESHDHGLYTIDHPLRVLGAEFGTRTTVVQLPAGGVLLISPGPLHANDIHTLSELGGVAGVVAPNSFHYLFAEPALRAFPEAAFFAVPGLAQKVPSLPKAEVLGSIAPSLWSGCLEQHLLQASRRVNEVIFYHAASRSLIVTDLVFNLHDPSDLRTSCMWRLFGVHRRFGPSRLFRFLLRRNRPALQAALHQILRWEFDRVIPTHGDIVHEDGRTRLAAALPTI